METIQKRMKTKGVKTERTLLLLLAMVMQEWFY